MPPKSADLNRQLQHAQSDLDAWVKILDERGVTPPQRRRDPKWRSLNSRRRRLRSRLKTADEIVALDKETKRRKAEPSATDSKPQAKRAVSDKKKPKKVKKKTKQKS